MDIEALRTTTLAFVEAHKAWTPFIAGGLAFCESIAVLSLFVPATVIWSASAPSSAAPTSRSGRW